MHSSKVGRRVEGMLLLFKGNVGEALINRTKGFKREIYSSLLTWLKLFQANGNTSFCKVFYLAFFSHRLYDLMEWDSTSNRLEKYLKITSSRMLYPH